MAPKYPNETLFSINKLTTARLLNVCAIGVSSTLISTDAGAVCHNRVGNTDWCLYSNCYPMETERECLSCQKCGALRYITENDGCFTVYVDHEVLKYGSCLYGINNRGPVFWSSN